MAVQAQKHIHLSLTLGGAPENAPDTKYSVYKRTPVIAALLKIERGLTGQAHLHVLGDNAGDPIVFRNWRYQIKVDDGDALNTLSGLLGRRCYLVDSYHPDDWEDHTSHVRQVILVGISEIEHFNPATLSPYQVSIEVEDDSI